jgi:hypothetical protein
MKKITFSILILLNSVGALYAESNVCKNVFAIPTYPGMACFKCYGSGLAMLNPPFATSLKVLKTTDGSALSKEAVIKFYQDYYLGRGWQKGIDERQGDEPYLELRVQVYDPDAAQAQVHVAGTFHLWVAPQDGMLTIYMEQWRISSLKQTSQNIYTKIEEKLRKKSEEMNYSFLKAYTYSNWEDFYQNEYLVICKVFGLYDKTRTYGYDNTMGTGSINVTLLAYKNSAVANEQAKAFIEDDVLGNFRKIARRDNILVLFDTRDASQTNIVSRLVRELE